MPRCIASLLALLGSLPLPTAPRAAEPDPLWQKALAIGDASWGLYPRKMREHEKVYTEEGALKRETISTFELYRDAGGKVRARLLKCIRNGEDATATKQKEIDAVITAALENL